MTNDFTYRLLIANHADITGKQALSAANGVNAINVLIIKSLLMILLI